MDTITPAVLLLDLPTQALGGMDLLSFTTTPKFQGIKNLPPGLHFVFVGSTSTLSVRHGVWIKVTASTNASSSDLFIRKWDPSSEELVQETDVSNVLKHRANLGSIWRDHLTPYRQTASKDAVAEEESNKWVQLTYCISDDLLNRILSTNPEAWTLTSSSSAKQDLDDIPGLSSTSVISKEGQLHLLPIDLKQTWREGATGRERTEAAQDRSWLLSDLSLRYCSSDKNEMSQILGELQFCFCMVLTLNNYSCLEQWRRILNVIFTCTGAVTTSPDFFVRTLATLKLQLQHGQDVETGLFDLSDDGATFLKSLLSRFKKNLDRLPGNSHQDVLDELDDLLSYVQETLGWQMQQGAFARSGILSLEDGEEVEMDSTLYDEDDEEGEYAPTVVELTREQMEALGLSAEDVARVMGGSTNEKKTPKTPNLRDRLRKEDEEENGKASVYEVKSDGESSAGDQVGSAEEEEEEEMDLEDMDSR